MEMDKKQKFDGYAAQYDEWFMENDRLFTSELRLFMKVLGDIKGKRLLSVGCGSGLFESYIDCSGVEGIEPSRDMGEIAVKRGVNVIKFGLIEDVDLPDDSYDIIYFNGSSSYIEDLASVYGKCRKALKEGGRLILLDVPKESAFGFMYLLGKALAGFIRRVAFDGDEDQCAEGAGICKILILPDACEESSVHQRRGRGGHRGLQERRIRGDYCREIKFRQRDLVRDPGQCQLI